MASFVGSIMSSKDNPPLVIAALQVIELLLSKLPQQYRPAFRREGVLHEIEVRSTQDLTTKAAAKRSTSTTPTEPAVLAAPSSSTALSASPDAPTSADSQTEASSANLADTTGTPVNPPDDGLPPPSILAAMLPPPTKRSSSTPIDPQDAIIMRCRVIKFKYLNTPTQSQGDDPFEAMQALGRRLAHSQANEIAIRRTLGDIAALFTTSKESISSFELTKSGLVDELLEFATVEGRKGMQYLFAS